MQGPPSGCLGFDSGAKFRGFPPQLAAAFGLLLAAVVAVAHPALAADQAAPPAPAGETPAYIGRWVGSRLQCRKEETGPVKCGMPSPFQVEFKADGTGTCVGEGFPPQFLHEAKDDNKVVLMSTDKSRRWELFELRVENEFLSFQAYIYPEGGNKDVGEEYTHFVFDLARDTSAP